MHFPSIMMEKLSGDLHQKVRNLPSSTKVNDTPGAFSFEGIVFLRDRVRPL